MFRYDRLDELIKETGKKKNYLSIKMGYSSGRYLNDAKKQNTNIKGVELQILADELNTTPEYLTGETDIKEKAAPISEDSLDAVDIEILKLFNEAPEWKKKAALALLRAAEDGE